MAYRRALGDVVALVVVNAGDDARRLSIDLADLDGRTFAVQRWPGVPAGSWPDGVRVVAGRLDLDVPARDGAVLLGD